MTTLNVRLVFTDWLRDGRSVYQTEQGLELTKGSLHSGSTFVGTITLDYETAYELREALAMGYQPVFWLARAQVQT